MQEKTVIKIVGAGCATTAVAGLILVRHFLGLEVFGWVMFVTAIVNTVWNVVTWFKPHRK